MSSELPPLLAFGQPARLIPIVADSKKEERATSILLASFVVVPIFAQDILAEAGASVGTRSKIECYTEIVFKSDTKGKGPRPDGLIIISRGSKKWSALIESKIGNAELTNDQVEEYLSLAKQHKIDAVITISNQFATTPTHHPLKIHKSKTKSVDLFHFSWLSIKSKAALLMHAKGIEDPEQSYILKEIIRYFDHDSSGVTALTKMPGSWKDLCDIVKNKGILNKTSSEVLESVSGWHQLLRHLALDLSKVIRQPVSLSLSKQREKDADHNHIEDCTHLVQSSELKAEFNIPNAASKLALSADIKGKTIDLSMWLEAPKDKRRATASINWITRQFKGKNQEGLLIRAHWPKRIAATTKPLTEVFENPSVLLPNGANELPKAFEIIRVSELGGRFKGVKTFVEDVSIHFSSFYNDVGQHMTKWVAKAPKIITEETSAPIITPEFNQPLAVQKEEVERVPLDIAEVIDPEQAANLTHI